MVIGNQILCPQEPGSFHGSLQHETAKPGEDLRAAQNLEAGAFPQEVPPEAGKTISPPGAEEILLFLLNCSAKFFWLHLVPPSIFGPMESYRNQMGALSGKPGGHKIINSVIGAT